MEPASKKADHLVVLIHGLWGNPSHLEYLNKSLRERFNEDELHILVAKSNSSNFTYDGIETGGERITHEVEARIKELEADGSTIRKISVIGYSLGGLLARYAIGLLYSSGLFDKIQPVNFTTFAAPHLGVRTPLKGTASHLWNVVGARTLSASGRQLFLIDEFRDTGRPLLSVMADPKSIFIQGLSKFQHRTLYANIVNDRSTVYYTSAIDSTDPFVDLSKVSLNTVPGTQGILLDPSDPVSTKESPAKSSVLQKVSDGAVYAVTSIPFFVFLTVLLPFGSLYFLANAGIQSFRSTQRVQLHDSGKAGISVEKYRKTPFLIEEMRNVADRVYRHAAASGKEDYLSTQPDDAERQNLMAGKSSSSSTLVADNVDDSKAPKATATRRDSHKAFPTLALTDDQFDMIRALDDVGFTKYRVHISAVRHTHAAIIVRIPWRPGFGQGKVVVKHWIEGFVI